MSRINPIKKQFWITRDLDEKLERDADSCCLSQAEYVRLVLSGITPRAAPPKEFFELTGQLIRIGNNLNQIAKNLNAKGVIDSGIVEKELTELKHLRERLEQTFLGRGDTENGCE